MSCRTPASLDLNAAPDDLRPYSAIFMIMMVPASCANSGPATVHIFSLHFAVRYAFCISHARMSKLFKAAMVSAIQTESRNTTDEYVIEAGATVICPPPTSRAFLRKFSPSLISNIMWHSIF